MTPLPAGFERNHPITTSVKTSTFEDIKMLQCDLGLSSMEKTFDYCIAYTLHSKGITNVRKAKEESQLWFVRGTSQG
jgi:hypothetical protein